VTTTGLQRASLSGGVKNATQRYALPPPAVAVRNLVLRCCCATSSHCIYLPELPEHRAGSSRGPPLLLQRW